MPDQLVLFGLNHKTAPVDLRERCVFNPSKTRQFFERVRDLDDEIENVVLSTCNRTEVYARLPLERRTSSQDLDPHLRSLLDIFYETHEGSEDHFQDHLYFHRHSHAIHHLFRLAGGLDSQILGESQILGQIRSAYEFARAEGAVGRIFHKLFPAAIKTGRKVRTDTELGDGCLTHGQAAVLVAEQALGKLAGKHLVVIGSGKVAELAVRSFKDRGIQPFTLVNRSRETAEALMEQLGGGGEIRTLEELPEVLGTAHVIISSTSATEPVVTAELLDEALSGRDHPLLAIDLAVPRDFEPEAGELEGVQLYNVDDLQGIVRRNIECRQSEIPRAESIIQQELRTFLSQMNWIHLDPVIRHLISRFDDMRREELAKIEGSLTPEMHQVFDRFSEGLMKKFVHFPISKLKSLRDGVGLSPTEIGFLKRLFLDTEDPGREGEAPGDPARDSR